jgi:hypothetical protein
MKLKQSICHIHISQPQNSLLTPPLTLAAPLAHSARLSSIQGWTCFTFTLSYFQQYFAINGSGFPAPVPWAKRSSCRGSTHPLYLADSLRSISLRVCISCVRWRESVIRSDVRKTHRHYSRDLSQEGTSLELSACLWRHAQYYNTRLLCRLTLTT